MFILITVPILFPKNSLLYVIGVLYFSFQTWSLASETYGGPILSADSPLIYDDTNQTVRAEKNALLKSDNLLLHAGKIIWDRNQSIVTAEHDVILTARGYRMLCGFIQLDLESGDYMARDVRLGFHPWIFTAKELQKRIIQFRALQSHFKLEKEVIIHGVHKFLFKKHLLRTTKAN